MKAYAGEPVATGPHRGETQYDRCMGARKATATARVTVTIPSDLVPGIDRIEKNLTRFILETVRHEIQHRRRQEPLRPLRHPHPETAEPAELGPGKWAHGISSGRRSSR